LQAPKWVRRVVYGGVAAVTSTVGLAGLTANAAHATVTTNTIAGSDRYQTSAMVAETKFPSGVASGNVILATGLNYPDALAGNYLAGQDTAPVLLTTATSSDPAFQATVMPALGKLLPGATKNVIILGGTSAVGADVQSALTSAGYTVTRIGGATRYDTAQLVDTQSGKTPGNGTSGAVTCIVATGQNFADALAAGPLAWNKKFPIVLTDGTQTTLGSQAQATITADGCKHFLIMGGSAAISSGISTQLAGMGTVDKQFAGADRYDTASQIATYEVATYGFSASKLFLVSGVNFPDALSAGPLAGDPGPLVEDNGTTVTSGPATNECAAAGSNGTITQIGGSAANGSGSLAACQSAAQGSATTAQTSLPQLVSASILSTTSAAQASASNAAGTVVQYVFSQAITSGTFNMANFKVYTFDGTTNYAGTAVCGVTTGACPLAALSNPNAVNILFNQANLQSTTVAEGAQTLTLATVARAAVTTSSGANPDGSAAIGSASTNTLQAGVTAAPNVTGVATPRSAATAGFSAIDVTFDKTAFSIDPTVGPTADSTATAYAPGGPGFDIVYAAGSTGRAQGIAATGNQEAVCSGPNNTNTTTGNNLTVAGGQGTKTFTIICPDTAGAPGTTLTSGQIGRIIIQPNTVATTAGGANPNAFTEATATPHSTAYPTPSLTGVSIQAGASGQPDVEVFTFDLPFVAAATVPGDFAAYTNAGTSIVPAAAPGSCSTVVITAAGQCQVNSSSPTSVAFSFANGALATAVGGAAEEGAVTNSNNGLVNGDDSMGASNSRSTTVAPGTIFAPQVTALHVAAVNGVFSSSTTATFVFSEQLASQNGFAKFFVYDADGTLLSPGACTLGTGSANNTVTCSNFTQTGGSAATTTQLSNIALGAVDAGAVTGGGPALGTSANNNPEGSTGKS